MTGIKILPWAQAAGITRTSSCLCYRESWEPMRRAIYKAAMCLEGTGAAVSGSHCQIRTSLNGPGPWNGSPENTWPPTYRADDGMSRWLADAYKSLLWCWGPNGRLMRVTAKYCIWRPQYSSDETNVKTNAQWSSTYYERSPQCPLVVSHL